MSLTGIYLVITYVIGIISSQVSNYTDFEIDDYGNEIKCIRRNDSRSKLAIWILTIIAIIFMAFRKISATAIDEMIYRNRFIKFSSLSFKDAFFIQQSICLISLYGFQRDSFPAAKGC